MSLGSSAGDRSYKRKTIVLTGGSRSSGRRRSRSGCSGRFFGFSEVRQSFQQCAPFRVRRGGSRYWRRRHVDKADVEKRDQEDGTIGKYRRLMLIVPTEDLSKLRSNWNLCLKGSRQSRVPKSRCVPKSPKLFTAHQSHQSYKSWSQYDTGRVQLSRPRVPRHYRACN